jgi:hypothetical protein
VGGTVTATVVVQASEDGSAGNTATVAATSPDSNTANNKATATTSFAEPSISVSGSRRTSSRTLTNYAAATFTHASGVEPVTAFVATINWGDGTTSAGTITRSGTTYTVTGSHTYTTGGRHTITTTVTEPGSLPNTVEGIGKTGDDHPGRGPWRSRDVVHLPPRLLRLVQRHRAATH